MNSGNRGQIIICAIVFVPLGILISTWLYVQSMCVLYQNKLQSSLDFQALEILKIQAQGLQALGKINPTAKYVIDARRKIDAILFAATVNPTLLAQLIKLRSQLLKYQKLIAAKQEFIQEKCNNLSFLKSKNVLTHDFKNKATVQVIPQTFIMHVKKKTGYESETGAPLELNFNFKLKQNIKIKSQLYTQKILMKAPYLMTLKNINVESFAKIEMNHLEGPWEVRLRAP